MIAGLEIDKILGAEVIEAKSDSLFNGTIEVKEDRMQRYLEKLQVTLHRFKEWTLQHVPQDQNNEADSLANMGSSIEDNEINSGEVVQLMRLVVEEGHAEINLTSLTWDWRNKYVEYLRTGKLPSNPKESRALCTKAARFSLAEDGTLFSKTFDSPLAICLGSRDTEYILMLIHEVTFGNHSSAKSLVEAQVYEKVIEKEVINFISDHIICRFGIPAEIVCDNEKQFIGSKVSKFLEDHKIKRILSILYHPSGNGQAKSTNKTILQSLKKKLTDAKGKWKDMLPEVLWAYRTTSKSSTGSTPFSLVYGTEALIPVEVREPSIRLRYAMKESNDEAMSMSLELLDERREAALVRLAAQNQRIERYYNRRANL
ncbi:uncharacterized protein [Nicotiana tomentosiformis]|uniref:uncharacterized protein n=1 Tax=Nicotiana tomentosiformis TaxID=4098 RepID=UPI00388CE879